MRSAMLQTCFRFKKAGAPLRIKLRTLIQLKLLLRRQRTVVEGSALSDGLGAGLQLTEDLHGTRVSGRYHSSRHSIKRRIEMVVGFWHTILFQ